MLNFELRLSQKIDSTTHRREILLRAYLGKKFDQRCKTNIFVDSDHFAYYIDRRSCAKMNIQVPPELISATEGEAMKYGYILMNRGEIVVKERKDSPIKSYYKEQIDKLNSLKTHITTLFDQLNKDNIPTDWLKKEVDRYNFPEKYESAPRSMTMRDYGDIFLAKKKHSRDRRKGYLVLFNDWVKYEMFVKEYDPKRKKWRWDINKVTTADLEDFQDYLKNEKNLSDEYPELFKRIFIQLRLDNDRSVKRRLSTTHEKGNNTVIGLMKKFRAFFYWLKKEGITKNDPFADFEFEKENYGVPYYLTIEERNKVQDFDLSSRPQLATQRDIFVFQCLVGCRISDLNRMTPENIIEGQLQYIANKTKKNSSDIIRVPLGSRALELIDKYKGKDAKGRLFPFISDQNYNYAIKEILTICGITRRVIILNPTTGEEESRPINEIASSHMARRTFIGAAYKVVKDPNLIGKMSGHVANSKAFIRYRDIDKDDLKNVIDAIQ